MSWIGFMQAAPTHGGLYWLSDRHRIALHWYREIESSGAYYWQPVTIIRGEFRPVMWMELQWPELTGVDASPGDFEDDPQCFMTHKRAKEAEAAGLTIEPPKGKCALCKYFGDCYNPHKVKI